MLLRLQYVLKTNKDTRTTDKREYEELRKKLADYHSEMTDARAKISNHLGDLNNYGIHGCFSRGYCDDYTCTFFDWEKQCTQPLVDCPIKHKNTIFFQARQKYQEQQKLVNDFWKERMKERVK